MKTIPLDRDLFALCDDEDYERLLKFNWSTIRRRNTWYARAHRRIAKWKYDKILMHRFVMNAAPGQQIDHWNGDGLDNQKSNLRFVNHAQQQMNSPAKNGRQFKGVFKYRKSWHAQICGKRLGSFNTAEEAALAYNVAAVQRFGQFARLNQLTKPSMDLYYCSMCNYMGVPFESGVVRSDHEPSEAEVVAALQFDQPANGETISIVKIEESDIKQLPAQLIK